jgi:serine/threonine protein kinase
MESSEFPHPDDGTLKEYGLGLLDGDRASSVDEHLGHCAGCRGRLSSLSSDSLMGRIREIHRISPSTTTGPHLPGIDPSQIERWESSNGSDTLGPLPAGLADHPGYEVRREIGRGGMGVVYLAHNRMMGRDEVLKVIGPHYLDRSGVVERFQREIRAVASLRHPNIVAAHAAFRIEGGLVLAMEYVDGLDLARVVKLRGPFAPAEAARLIHQAAQALQHAHDRGVIHRDIKPHNLMLASDGASSMVKILDFGLAKATLEQGANGELTSEGQTLGSPDFIAPEQILHAVDVDIRADLYGLGATLYYLLTGRTPFASNSIHEIYLGHISGNAEPPHRLNPDVPAGLSDVVGKMMAKEPKDRHQSPAEVCQALAPFLARMAPGHAGEAIGEVPDEGRLAGDAAVASPLLATSPDGDAPKSQGLASTWDDPVGGTPTAGPTSSLANEEGRGWRRVTRLLLGLTVLGGLAFGILIQLSTPEGTITVENVPESAEVRLDGRTITLRLVNGKEPLKIRAVKGQHVVEVIQGTNRLLGETVSITRGGQEVKVSLRRPVAPEPRPSKPVAPGVAGPWLAKIRLGHWAIDGTDLIQTEFVKGYGARLVFGDPKWSNYDFSFQAMSFGGTQGFGAVFHFTEPDSLWTFAAGNYENKGFEVSIVDHGKFERKKPEMYRWASIEFDRWYRVKVEVRGTDIRCFLDDEEMFHQSDPRFTAGQVGFSMWNATCRFRNIRVTSPVGKVLFEGLPTLPDR